MIHEEALFFPGDGYRLYGIVSRPADPSSKNACIGVVLCEPFGEEKLFAQRVIANLARTLAENSFWVLRFDCMGHGDSEGNYEDSTVGTRLADVAAAVRFLRECSGASKIGLFGLRLGGTLAVMAAERDPAIDFVIACQPVVRGDKYFYECLRSNLTMQMAMYGKVVVNRDELVKRLEQGESVNIDGYFTGPRFYAEILGVDLGRSAATMRQPLLLVQAAKSENAPRDRELEPIASVLGAANPLSGSVVVKEDAFWKDIPPYYTKADNMAAAVLKWLRQLAGGSS